MKILLIEDDIQLSTTIKNFLLLKNKSIHTIYNGNEAIDIIDNMNFNLYIIDINLPEIDGLSILKYIRQKDTITPIIIITASMELNNIKVAFENGCDEYIKKPFYLEELEIRINKLTNKQNDLSSVIQISDSITYDMKYEELIVNGEVKRLRKKEKRLLNILLQNVNKTVESELIQNYVWENELKDNYPIRQLVNDLRKHLDTNHKFIYTDFSNGYRFELNQLRHNE